MMIRLLFTTALVLGVLGCKPTPAATCASEPKVATLVPAGTDLLLAMGACDHLVAVSNFDTDPRVEKLPRAGDYQTTDWELLTSLRPRYMFIQIDPTRLPDGFRQRASGLGIEFVDLKLDRVADILAAARIIGEKVKEQEKGSACAAKIQAQLDTIRARVAGAPKARTLIVIDSNGQGLAGAGTFLDDLLTDAGGENAAAGLAARYPSVDREQLLALKPDAIIQLLPGASAQLRQSAGEFWKTMPNLPAERAGRICIITEPYGLVPGARIGDLAEQFADFLHPAIQPRGDP